MPIVRSSSSKAIAVITANFVGNYAISLAHMSPFISSSNGRVRHYGFFPVSRFVQFNIPSLVTELAKADSGLDV